MIRKVDILIGSLVLLLVLTLLSVFVFSLYKSDLFDKRSEFYLSADSGVGLNKGMSLVYSGFPIGEVKDLELTGNGKVQLRVSVPDKQMRWLRQGSQFILKANILGATSIEVVTDDLEALPFLHGNNVLIAQLEMRESLQESLEPLIRTQVAPILKNLNILSARLASNNEENSLAAILRNITQMTGKIAEQGDALDLLVAPDSEGNSVGVKIHALLDDTQLMAGELSEELQSRDGILFQVRDLLETLVHTISQIDPVLNNVEALTGNVAESTTELGVVRQQLEDMILQVNEMLSKANQILPGGSKLEGGMDHL